MKLVTRRRRRQEQQARDGLPDLIELIIIGVRAGLAPAAAFEMAAEHASDELRVVLDDVRLQMHRGRRLSDALETLPIWLGHHAAYFTDALITADRYGLALAPVLDQLGADVRLERSRQVQRDARTLPVKLSFPLVVCTLPSFVLLAIAPAVLGAVSTLTTP